jgi:hypothetical protein
MKAWNCLPNAIDFKEEQAFKAIDRVKFEGKEHVSQNRNSHLRL